MTTLQHSGLIIPESQKATDFLEGWLRLWKQENKGVSISGLIVRANNDLISFTPSPLTPSPSTTGIVEPQAATDLFEDLLNNWRNNNPGKTLKSFFINSNNNQISFAPSPQLPNNRLKPDDLFIKLE